MITRVIIALSVALFFAPAATILAQEHPEHPKKSTEPPKQGPEQPKKGGAEKQVSTADISAGIKKNIDAQSKKSTDQKFHVKYEGQDLALDLIKVHDDRLQDLGGGVTKTPFHLRQIRVRDARGLRQLAERHLGAGALRPDELADILDLRLHPHDAVTVPLCV